MSEVECPIRDCDWVDTPDEVLHHFIFHRLYKQKYTILDFLYNSEGKTPPHDSTNPFAWSTKEKYQPVIEEHPVFNMEMVEAYFGSIESAIRQTDLKSEDADYYVPDPKYEERKREKSLSLGGYDSKKYGTNYPEQRRKALERDDLTCRVCGDDHTEVVHTLQVHHITPVSSFHDSGGDVDYESMNALSNLITLCASCHGNLEGRWTDVDHNQFTMNAKEQYL